MSEAATTTSPCIPEGNKNLCCDHLNLNYSLHRKDPPKKGSKGPDCPINCLNDYSVDCKEIIMKAINGLDNGGTFFLPEERQDGDETEVSGSTRFFFYKITKSESQPGCS